MKHILYLASFVALAVVTSCGTKPGEAQADGSSTVTPINVNGNGLPQSTSPITTPSTTTTTQPIAAPNVTTTTIPTATTTTVQHPTTTTVSTAKGMNPAHGQPGHRCEIEVGAPLNSAPTKNVAATTPTVTSSPVITQNPVVTSTTPTITSTPTKVKTAPGMNPPHGEPGHRCDITVGEPLNSKPAATTTTTATPAVNSNVVPGSIKPSIVNTTPAITTPTTATTAAKTAPGMNPAHGQPGHKCEIAVGAPLNSKPEPLKVVTPEKKN